VVLDRKGEVRPRAVWTGLPLAGEIFTKSFAVGITSKADVIDNALPKILCAEETGDGVSDLYDALR
jgi:hypothetical protein